LKKKHLSLEKFKNIPRLNLANLFTPIEECNRLRKKIPGCPHVYIKRDDFIGYIIGGNKIRKLEYIMPEVLRKKTTTLLTTGSIQSNCARVTAMIAKRQGMKCVLVLNGDIPKEPRGNFRIISLLDVEVRTVETRAQRNPRMNEVEKELESKGEVVYKIPLGGSDEIGAFGCVAALEEVCIQQKQMGVNFDAIIIASSSGGTQAGLEVGKRLFGLENLRIMGISPDDPSESIKDSMMKIMNPMLSRIGLNSQIDRTQLLVDDKYFGEGYGIPTKESEEAAKLFSQTEGILLDPVYTSKVAAAFIDYCRKEIFNSEDRVLFWHTGGLMSLFK